VMDSRADVADRDTDQFWFAGETVKVRFAGDFGVADRVKELWEEKSFFLTLVDELYLLFSPWSYWKLGRKIP